MHATFVSNPSFRLRMSACPRRVVLGSLLLAAIPLMRAQSVPQPALGMAWQVRGQWQLAGKGAALGTGDAIPPGALLLPGPLDPGKDAGSHSIRVYLPDGQHVF